MRPSDTPFPDSPPPADLSDDELAERLRPYRLVGDYLYELVDADLSMARAIKAARDLSLTTPSRGFPADSPGGVKPQYVLGTDDRGQTTDASQFTGSATGQMNDVNGNPMCTVAMIGRSTALCAAHCFYLNGTWGSTGYISFGENNWSGTVTTPFGTHSYNTVSLPSTWFTGAGAVGGQGTSSSHSGWDYDFAIVEFAPTLYPGDSTGYYGTATDHDGSGWNQYTMGYPSDKATHSQWGAYGGEFAGAWGARQVHYIDIVTGNSGGCIRTYDSSAGTWYCTAIQSTQWTDSSSGWKYSVSQPSWNEGKDWDSTTYTFFHTYAYSWP